MWLIINYFIDIFKRLISTQNENRYKLRFPFTPTITKNNLFVNRENKEFNYHRNIKVFDY